jgi:hypothetical protein
MTLSNVRGTAVSLRKDISLEFKNQENTGDKFYWDTTRSTVHVLAKGLPEGLLLHQQVWRKNAQQQFVN